MLAGLWGPHDYHPEGSCACTLSRSQHSTTALIQRDKPLNRSSPCKAPMNMNHANRRCCVARRAQKQALPRSTRLPSHTLQGRTLFAASNYKLTTNKGHPSKRTSVGLHAVAGNVDAHPAQQPASQSPSSQQYDWFNNWYPICFERDIDKTKPYRFVLLGTPLVVWWEANRAGGSWKVSSGDHCSLRPISNHALKFYEGVEVKWSSRWKFSVAPIQLPVFAPCLPCALHE